MGIISKREWFIIFSSLISISSGFSLSCNFFPISCASIFVDCGISSRCSFGIIRECPLLSGLSSKIATLCASSPIL